MAYKHLVNIANHLSGLLAAERRIVLPLFAEGAKPTFSSDPDSNRPRFSEPVVSGGRVLEGFHILVAEDDCYQCDGIVGCLNDAGAIVLGPAHNTKDAMQLAVSNGIHAGIVDINLGDGPSFELANYLRLSGVPFFFITGYDCGHIPPELETIECLEKPFTEHDLLRATMRAVNGGAST